MHFKSHLVHPGSFHLAQHLTYLSLSLFLSLSTRYFNIELKWICKPSIFGYNNNDSAKSAYWRIFIVIGSHAEIWHYQCTADSKSLWYYFLHAGKTDNRPFRGVFRRGLDFLTPSKNSSKWSIICFARIKNNLKNQWYINI